MTKKYMWPHKNLDLPGKKLRGKESTLLNSRGQIVYDGKGERRKLSENIGTVSTYCTTTKFKNGRMLAKMLRKRFVS